jgi:hypothetical protein
VPHLGARCARVSYKTFDGKPTTIEADLGLFEKLVGGAPIHASPTEHQATAGLLDGSRQVVAGAAASR